MSVLTTEEGTHYVQVKMKVNGLFSGNTWFLDLLLHVSLKIEASR